MYKVLKSVIDLEICNAYDNCKDPTCKELSLHTTLMCINQIISM